MTVTKNKMLTFFAFIAILFQVFISYPIAAWARNKANFDAGLVDSIGIFIAVLAMIMLLSALLVSIIPSKIRVKILPFLIMIGVLIYLQQNFLIWDYGILDGALIDFSKNLGLGLIDLAVWAGGISLAIFFRQKIMKNAANIFLALGALTVISSSVKLVTFGESPQSYSLTEAAKFDFSPDENVLVFMLDGFQSDLLFEALDKNPKFEKDLDGFTLYENNSSVFAKTYTSIPLMLTGEVYRKEEPLLEFIDKVYDDSLMSDMKNNGWDVGLYPYTALTMPVNPKIMDNLIGGTIWVDKLDSYLQTLDLSLFRMAPHFLKPIPYNKSKFVAKEALSAPLLKLSPGKDKKQVLRLPARKPHKALSFLDNMQEFGNASVEKPTFRFYHLLMPHAPLNLDRDLNYGDFGTSFEAYQDYVHASVTLLTMYLEELKKLGVYDNSTIMIVSDHGNGVFNTNQYVPETQSYRQLKKYGFARSAAKSIFLVKKRNAKGQLKRSQKPVSGIDIAPTIARKAGFPEVGFEGLDVDRIGEADVRERFYNFYKFTTWDTKYLENFDTYTINGDVRDDDAWQSTGELVAKVKFDNNATYAFGKTIGFGDDIKNDTVYSNAFLVDDQYRMDANYAEVSDGDFGLDIKLSDKFKSGKYYVLEYDLSSLDPLTGNVMLNGQTIDTFASSVSKGINRSIVERHVIISPKLLNRNKLVNVTFSTKEAKGTNSLRLSRVKLSELSLPVLKSTSQVNFTEDLSEFYPTGYRRPTKFGTWSQLPTSTLSFGVEKQLCNGRVIALEIRNFNAVAKPDEFVTKLNGKPLTAISAKNTKRGRIYYYPCEAVSSEMPNVFEFDTVNVGSSTNPTFQSTFGALFSQITFPERSEVPGL